MPALSRLRSTLPRDPARGSHGGGVRRAAVSEPTPAPADRARRGLAALCAVVGGYGLPLGIVAAVVTGWGTAAACHLVLGAPNGLPSAAKSPMPCATCRSTCATSRPRHARRGAWRLSRAPMRSVVRRAGGVRPGRRGRAVAAQGLALLHLPRLGPDLVFNRLQQVEHEAYLTFLAEHAGVLRARRWWPPDVAARAVTPPWSRGSPRAGGSQLCRRGCQRRGRRRYLAGCAALRRRL